MASEIGTWVYGNEAGPGSTFIACACVTKIQENNGKYDVTVQYKVRVIAQTNGFGSTIATASWMSEKFTMAGKNSTFDVEATITNKVYKNQVGGTVLSLPFSAQYSTSSTTYKSSATLEYLVPNSVYTITYKPNAENVTSMPESQTKKHNEDVILNPVYPQREGYFLYEWNTSADGGGICYLPEEVYSDNANLTLYAIWEEKSYKITYYGNGGSNCPTEQNKWHFSDSAIKLSTQEPTRPGYKFLGWSTESDLSSNKVTYNPGDTYTVNEDINLYALWELQNIAYYKLGGKYVMCNTYGKVNGKWQPRMMYIKVNGKYVRSNGDINTEGRTIVGIYVNCNTSVSYYAGESITRIQDYLYVEAEYSDGTYSEIKNYNITNETSLNDLIVEGDNTIKISYGGFYETFIIKGKQPSGNLVAIIATSNQNIFVGTPIDALINDKMISVTARYSDGSSVDVTDSCTLSYDYSIIIEGDNEVTVIYQENVTTTITIYGIPEVTISSIQASYNGDQAVAGQSLDVLLGKINVTATYNDGSEVPDITEGFTLSSKDGNKIIEGRNTITVTYEGKTTRIYVTGIPKEISGVEFADVNSLDVAIWGNGITAPQSISYANNIEVIGGQIQLVNPSTVSFSKSGSGNDYTVLLGKYIVNGSDVYYVTTNSEYQYQSNYNEYVDAKITYYSTLKLTSTGEVLEIDRIEAEYTGGSVEIGTSVNDLDTNYINVTVFYVGGTSHTVNNYTLSGNISNVGDNTITVTYEGKTDDFIVIGKQTQVTEVTLKEIIVTYSGNTNVDVGTDISTLYDFVKVDAVYSDGNVVEYITGYSLSSGTIVEGNNTIVVTYESKTDDFVVNGIPKEVEVTLDKIEVEYTGNSDYEVGTNITDLRNYINVYAIYTNGDRTKVNSSDYTMTSGTIKEGENTIVVTYNGKTDDFIINGIPVDVELERISAQYIGADVIVGTSVSSLALSTFEVLGHYTDGSEGDIKEGFTISGGSNGKIVKDKNTITVTYEGKTTTCIVYGFDNVVSGIQRGDVTSLAVATWSSSITAPQSVSYSDSVEIIETDIQLVNPSTVSFSKSGSGNDYTVLLGKYIYTGNAFYYINANSHYNHTTNYGYTKVTYYLVQKLSVTAERQKVTKITAEYNGDPVLVGTPLDMLNRDDIRVIATYGDGTEQPVTSYTLSGSITNVGNNNTITVSYSNRTATFKVEGLSDESGLTMVTGTITNSTTINTGLSSIEQFVIYRDSISSVGLANGSYNASLGIATANITSADSLLKSGDVGYVHDGIIVNGGTVTWNPSSGSSGQLASGVTYNWIAIGEK